MEANLKDTIDASLEVSKSSASSWKIPFLIVVLVLIAAAIGLFVFYKRLLKRHLL
jgi:hypothetical protein